MKSVIRIAQIKFVPELFKIDENHARLMTVLDEVKEHRPDVVITPECFLDGLLLMKEGITMKGLSEYAIDPETSSHAQEVSQWAGDNNSWFVLGCCTNRPEGVYNSAEIFNRTGERIGIYDKVHSGGGVTCQAMNYRCSTPTSGSSGCSSAPIAAGRRRSERSR